MMDNEIFKVLPSAKIKCVSKLCDQSMFWWCCKTESVYFFIWHPLYAPKPLSSLFTYSKAWSTPMAINLSSVLSHVQFVSKSPRSPSLTPSAHTNELGEQASSELNSEGPNRINTLRSYLVKQDVCKLHNFCRIALMYSNKLPIMETTFDKYFACFFKLARKLLNFLKI